MQRSANAVIIAGIFLLTLTSCTPPAASGSAEGGGSAPGENSPAATTDAFERVSDYGPCPDGLLDKLNSVSTFTWTPVKWSGMVLPDGLPELPVPSCVMQGADPSWTEAYSALLSPTATCQSASTATCTNSARERRAVRDLVVHPPGLEPGTH